MSTHVGDIFFDAKINRKQYDKDLGALGKTAQSVSKKIGALLTIGAFTKFIKDATSAGASLNAMGTIIDASLPHMTEQVDRFAKSAGNMFGLSETQAKGFVGKFASMASAMGYTEKSAYNMSTALTGMAGDVASYYHISADEAFAKLGAIFTGETESLKQLGVVMTQNALDSYALANGYGKVTRQMTEMEKTTLRYNFVMDKLKLASGDFAKYANTWSGSIATIKLNWSNFMATMGQGLINILLPVLQMIARISQALGALASRFLGWTQKLMGIKKATTSALGKNTQKDITKTGNAVNNVGSGLNNTGKSAKGAKKAIKALKKELLGFDQIVKLTKTDTSTGTGGAGGISGGDIGGLADDWAEIGDSVGIIGEAVDYLANLKLPQPLVDALGNLKEAMSGLFSLLKDAGKWVLENVLKPLGEWLMNSGLPVAINLIANVIKTITSALGLLGDILEPIWTYILKPIISALGNDLVNRMQMISDAIGKLPNVLDSAKRGFDKFKEGWQNATSGLKDKLSDIKSKWESFKNNKASLTLSVTKGIESTIAKIKTAWTSIKDKTATLKMKLVESFKNTYNNLATKVNNARAKSAIVRGLFPNALPYLSQGGFVKRNTPQLAVIGDNKREGEIVAPESKMMEMARMASAESTAQTVAILNQILSAVRSLDLDVTLDGESIKKNTVRRINQHTMATGRLELII